MTEMSVMNQFFAIIALEKKYQTEVGVYMKIISDTNTVNCCMKQTPPPLPTNKYTPHI